MKSHQAAVLLDPVLWLVVLAPVAFVVPLLYVLVVGFPLAAVVLHLLTRRG
jgi:hypothetical protein